MKLSWRLGVVAALLAFLFYGDAPEVTRFWTAFFDAGHTVLFGVIALVVHHWLRSRRPPGGASDWLAAFAITVVLGAATEVLQTLQARGDPSVTDLLRDTAGAGAFLLVAWVMSAGSAGRRRGRLAALTLAIVLLVAAGWTLMLTSARYLARDRAYPTLFAFDGSWWEGDFMELGQNRLTPRQQPLGGGVRATSEFARLDLAPGPYSGITFDELYPDWRGRAALTMTIVSDLAAPLPLVIRVHDAAHDQRYRDRFNRGFTIVPGINRVRIPIEDIHTAPDRRKMDMRRIRGLLLFTYDLKKPARIFLGPLRLE